MIILPAIDLLGGRCVRLLRGEYDSAAQVAPDAAETAAAFRAAGAEYLHIVDLDGAKNGRRVQSDLICEIARTCGMPVEVGGGIRTREDAAYYLEHAVSRVILGSAALTDPELVRDCIALYGSEKIAVGIDARQGMVSTSGWLKTSRVSYLDLAEAMAEAGVRCIIFTDIERDGTLSGANTEQLEALCRAVPGVNIIASGGVSGLEDIVALRKLPLYGAIAGKAIYSGRLDLREAIAAAR